ncbi:Pre-mRNA-splicing factor SLU7 [Zancudomyces culisetae]|uniref:Pre-mRNA-splicing factor SLU7 n=1 Tax=Zancudomyces culisetae TaxID=1213189 RepID=A0A1R1PM75_ZANCU|nr:Pre-mRNA-splicing factor SLU7 [Zancudomyces culisetae]OMH82068.1 Pre-mRNA-splicing factor SLU7 [Zancudomyces culisetae]|eukprot:OMH78595.1 Pre-mRNA-splicing factor SLU7 [Zancudomyces culisetae]
MIQAPWYVDTSKPGLKHQRKQGEEKKASDGWYSRGARKEQASTKYRKGACENCGAGSHKTKDCMERPRKKGAKWTGKDIQPDEIVETIDFDYDKKRDRWNGYDSRQHLKLVEEWELIEEARKKRKAQELDEAIASGNIEGTNLLNLGDSSSEEDNEDKYAESIDMPGQKLDVQSRTTIRNLRIREDTAKYLHNLDPNSAYYDPKSRSMRDNPHGNTDPRTLAYAGDNFSRSTGEITELTDVQAYVWEIDGRTAAAPHMAAHLQANPTQTVLLKKQEDQKKLDAKEQRRREILQKYADEESQIGKEAEKLAMAKQLTQTERYVEYSRHGQVVKGGGGQHSHKSQYVEDVYPNNHTSVWGSYWKDGKWGYKCCHQFFKNSYCVPL